MQRRKKRLAKFFKRAKWLGLAMILGAVSLGVSSRIYVASLYRNLGQEVQIAQVGYPDELTFTKAGEVRVYFLNNFPDHKAISVKLKNKAVAKNIASIVPKAGKDTGLMVKAGDKVNFRVYDRPNFKFEGYSWVNAKATGCHKWTTPVTSFVKEVKKLGEPLVSVQCWSDHDTASTEPKSDYNDYLVIFSYKPKGGVSPSPSVSPTNKASFIIRKFNDKNKNGKLNQGETGTGLVWSFQYRLNNGPWKNYRTQAGTGHGVALRVLLNTRVEVKEKNKAGWDSVTTNPQVQLLTKAKRYLFDFGNFKLSATPSPGVSPSPRVSPSPSPSPSLSPSPSPSLSPSLSPSPSPSPSPVASFPPKQPDTGSPTWLTAGVMGIGLVLLAYKLLAGI